MTGYKVILDVYNGPLDLLLFLIKREEIDIYDIPIARITEQYLEYVELLRQLDPEIVSEFLVLAATLMEIKSRTLLPRPPADDGEDELVDPRLELVRQLLEYKKYKDAARLLEGAAVQQSEKHPRFPVVPARGTDEVDLESLDIWDLFHAFSRLLEQTGRREAVQQIGVDDTPMALHAEDILDSIERAGGGQQFEEIFAGRSKAEMIGLFLALLELIRRRRIRASQDRPFGPIWIHLLDPTPLDADSDVQEEAAEPGVGEDEGAPAVAADVTGRPHAAPDRRTESTAEALKPDRVVKEASRAYGGGPKPATTATPAPVRNAEGDSSAAPQEVAVGESDCPELSDDAK